MKTIINENQRGLLFKNGKFIKILNPGKYNKFMYPSIEILSLDQCLSSNNASLDTLLLDKNIQKNTTVIKVLDQELALHYVDGAFYDVLSTGQYAFWNIHHKHEFHIIDISQPYVDKDIPRYIFQKIPTHYYLKIEVNEYQKARLFIDHQFVELLDSGTYYFWRNQSSIEYQYIDTRLIQMNIIGQEILTLDKVSIRINFVCFYKLLDYMKIYSEIDNYEEQIRTMTQLIMRKYIGQYKIDDILENKDTISQEIFQQLKQETLKYYIDIVEAGMKDIILPGEMRNIMNTVLIAQKKAQANVITRREEVASTRSLLNTAKLMEENKTLYKLKELEYLERICENVGEITVDGSQHLLSQLTTILSSHERK